MRNYTRVICAPLLLVSLQSALFAQKNFSSLPSVADKIERKISQVLPEWERHEIQPGALPPPGHTAHVPSDDKLIIRQWDNREQRVRVILARYDTQAEAVEVIRHCALVQRGTLVNGLGNEAYVYGLDGDLVIRAGNVIVYVSATVSKGVDPAAGINSLLDAARAGHAAAIPIARGFARHIDDALGSL